MIKIIDLKSERNKLNGCFEILRVNMEIKKEKKKREGGNVIKGLLATQVSRHGETVKKENIWLSEDTTHIV